MLEYWFQKRIWRPRAHFGSENESLNGLMDFITYLFTKIIFIKSNIGDPTLEIWLKNEADVDG